MLVTIIREKISKEEFKNIDSKEILLKLEPNELSAHYITAYFKGEKIGFVSLSPSRMVSGTESGEYLFNKINETGNTMVNDCEVVEFKEVVSIKTETVMVLNVPIGEVKSSKTSDEKMFTLKISGSASIFKGKAQVIEDFAKSGSVSVDVKLEKDSIITEYNGVPAGKVSERISDDSLKEDVALLKKVLMALKEGVSLEAKVYNTSANYFTIQVVVGNEFTKNAEKSFTKKAIGDKKEELLKEGFKEEILNQVEDYLLSLDFKAEDINDIFNTYISYNDEYKHLIPVSVPVLFEDKNKDMVIDAITNILYGGNILCSGEKGTGKNVFIETLAWILQRPLFAISINSETDKIDMIGTRSIEPVMVKGSDGVEVPVNKIIFQREVLLDAMECGGILNVDEINFADPGITGLLHSVCDDRKEIFVPGYGVVKANSNFCIMATMNIGYEGTNELNEALSDRFVDIKFENNDGITDILKKNCVDYQKPNLTVCNKVYSKIYNLLKDRDSAVDESCLTVRGYIQALNMSKRIPIKRALTRCVADKIRDEDYRNNVLEIIESYC